MKKFLLRISEEDFKKLEELAKKDDRSINSMICQIIKKYKGSK